MAYRPILCLDWDGVVHSYTSGWKGARVIPDPIVPGALEFIVKVLGTHRVAIFSSRTHQWGGRRAMKHYLRDEFVKASQDWASLPEWHKDWIAGNNYNETRDHDIRAGAVALVKACEWPLFKPPAVISIDDRAVTFSGDWTGYTPEFLANFKPWNKRAKVSA